MQMSSETWLGWMINHFFLARYWITEGLCLVTFLSVCGILFLLGGGGCFRLPGLKCGLFSNQMATPRECRRFCRCPVLGQSLMLLSVLVARCLYDGRPVGPCLMKTILQPASRTFAPDAVIHHNPDWPHSLLCRFYFVHLNRDTPVSQFTPFINNSSTPTLQKGERNKIGERKKKKNDAIYQVVHSEQINI